MNVPTSSEYEVGRKSEIESCFGYMEERSGVVFNSVLILSTLSLPVNIMAVFLLKPLSSHKPISSTALRGI